MGAWLPNGSSITAPTTRRPPAGSPSSTPRPAQGSASDSSPRTSACPGSSASSRTASPVSSTCSSSPAARSRARASPSCRTARIEAAINRCRFPTVPPPPGSRAATILDDLPTAIPIAEVLQPLEHPKSDPKFYIRVALQHDTLVRDGDPDPSATMTEVSGVALSTAQGWAARAREQRLLPPARREQTG